MIKYTQSCILVTEWNKIRKLMHQSKQTVWLGKRRTWNKWSQRSNVATNLSTANKHHQSVTDKIKAIKSIKLTDAKPAVTYGWFIRRSLEDTAASNSIFELGFVPPSFCKSHFSFIARYEYGCVGCFCDIRMPNRACAFTLLFHLSGLPVCDVMQRNNCFILSMERWWEEVCLKCIWTDQYFASWQKMIHYEKHRWLKFWLQKLHNNCLQWHT